MRVAGGIGQRLRAGALALCCVLGMAGASMAKDKHVFVIHVAPPVNPETVQVGYFVTGDFGGAGNFRVETGEQEIGIRLDQTSKPPKTLKALLYAPGCEIALIRVDDLKVSEREAQFNCKPLPSIDIAAEFPRPAVLKGLNLEVDVNYVAEWSHDFFGITDGTVQTFRIATVSLGRDAAFRFELPDFSKDRLFDSLENKAYLTFHLRERGSGNFVAELKGLDKIQANYPQPLIFTFVAMR